MWAADIIVSTKLCFLSAVQWYNKLNSLEVTQASYLLLGLAENWIVFWDFKILNNIWIVEGSDSGDSDNQGPTVLLLGKETSRWHIIIITVLIMQH